MLTSHRRSCLLFQWNRSRISKASLAENMSALDLDYMNSDHSCTVWNTDLNVYYQLLCNSTLTVHKYYFQGNVIEHHLNNTSSKVHGPNSSKVPFILHHVIILKVNQHLVPWLSKWDSYMNNRGAKEEFAKWCKRALGNGMGEVLRHKAGKRQENLHS